MTADTPAASKDAPTDEAVKAAMARVLDPGEDMPVNDPWPFNVLLDAYVGLRADGLALAAHVAALTSKLKSLQARLEDVSAQLEAERATGDETARHISRLLDHLARETARADAAEKEVKALREAAEQAYGYLWVTSAMIPKDDPVSLARKRLLDEIGGLNSAGQRRGIAFATDRFEVGPDGVRPKRATLAQPAAKETT